jgi:prepilin-type N-terminal cleavage/methylation domain-containing protein
LAKVKKKVRSFLLSTSGFSLTEVLIAIVILGLAGITIINGMTTDTKVRGKTNTATNVSVNLNAAAETLLSSNVSLTPCNSTTDDVYTGKINSIPNVTVTKVEALTRETNPTWLTCETSSYANSAAQRITLQSINAGTTMQKIILKTSSTNSTSVATPFSIDASKSTVTIAAQGDSTCGSFDTLNLSNSLGSNSIVYSAISTDPTKISSATSGSNLTINGLAAGTSSVTIQGINASNGVTSNPITINATVVPAIRFTSPSSQISVVNPHGRVITGSLSVSGGSSSVKSFSSQNLNITGSTYSFDARQVSSPTTFTNPITISDPGLPNASGCTSPSWSVPVTVQAKLAFTLNTSSKCLIGTASSCSIPVLLTAGTGSGQSISSGPGVIYSAPNLSLPATSCGAAVTSFKPSSPLSNLTPSSIQVILKGSSFFTQFDPANAKSVNLYMTKNGTSFSLNNWKIESLSTSGSGGNSQTTLVISSTSSTQDVAGATPTKIEIAVLNSIYPQLTDSNFSNSYLATSSTLLDQYCN